MRAAGRGGAGAASGTFRPRVRRPSAGVIHRHRAICAIILAHPELVPDMFESLLGIVQHSFLEFQNRILQ